MLNAIDEWLSSPQSAARLLAPGAKAEDLHRAERALSDIRMAEVDQPQTIRLGTRAARVDRIDLDATGLTIAFRLSDLRANIDPQRLMEHCVIRSDLAFGRRGQGLRLIIG